jgi:hypothetical protein
VDILGTRQIHRSEVTSAAVAYDRITRTDPTTIYKRDKKKARGSISTARYKEPADEGRF